MADSETVFSIIAITLLILFVLSGFGYIIWFHIKRDTPDPSYLTLAQVAFEQITSPVFASGQRGAQLVFRNTTYPGVGARGDRSRLTSYIHPQDSFDLSVKEGDVLRWNIFDTRSGQLVASYPYTVTYDDIVASINGHGRLYGTDTGIVAGSNLFGHIEVRFIGTWSSRGEVATVCAYPIVDGVQAQPGVVTRGTGYIDDTTRSHAPGWIGQEWVAYWGEGRSQPTNLIGKVAITDRRMPVIVVTPQGVTMSSS